MDEGETERMLTPLDVVAMEVVTTSRGRHLASRGRQGAPVGRHDAVRV